jgi:GNAT superfamily N-acetyltransferase
LNLTLSLLNGAEVPLLTRMMAVAFDADAPADPAFDRQLLDCYHNSDFFYRWPPACLDTFAYTLHVDATPSGAAVVWQYDGCEAVLGLLFVALDFQGRGLGLNCWRQLEELHPETTRWTVAAPAWSPATGRFYERQCGFYNAGMSGPHYICYAKERS